MSDNLSAAAPPNRFKRLSFIALATIFFAFASVILSVVLSPVIVSALELSAAYKKVGSDVILSNTPYN